jgi:hypothetical protein
MADISSLIEQMRAGRCRFQRSDIRRLLEHIAELEARNERILQAGKPLANAAFNISRMSLSHIDATHLLSLRSAQETWDAALVRPAQESQP